MTLSEDYYYQSLPLCAIDAVFSIGVKYSQVRNVIRAFCGSQNWRPYRLGTELPPASEQKTITDLLEILSNAPDRTEVFNNKCYANPSAESHCRIRKADLVWRFANVLHQYGVETLQDLRGFPQPERLQEALCELPTLHSGIVFRYFRMLAGDDTEVKPDRMIKRFIRAAGLPLQDHENTRAVGLIAEAADTLRQTFPHVTPRLLDYAIWLHQREQKNGNHLLKKHQASSPWMPSGVPCNRGC